MRSPGQTKSGAEPASDLHGRRLKAVQSGADSAADLLHSVLDSTADGILVVDREGRIVTYNRTFAAMWHLPDEVLATRDDQRALGLAVELVRDREAFLAKVRELYDHPEAQSFDVIELRDGRTFERYSQPHTRNGAIQGRIWSFRDVTERRRAKEQLERSERYFRTLTENARDLIAILGEDGMIRYTSPSHEQVLGYRADELVGTPIWDVLHPEDVEQARSTFVQGLAKTHIGPVELRIKHRDGSWRTIESIGRNLLDDPTVAGVVVNSRDVTERRLAELKTETLLAVASDINGTLDLREMLDRVQRRCVDALPCDVVVVFLEDPAQGMLRAISQHGFGPELAAAVDRLAFRRAELPFADRTARGETLVLPDYDAAPWLPPEMHQAAGVISMVVAPFNVWNRHIGLLVAANLGRGRPFDERQVDLATGIARQLALAIEAVELYRAQREEADVAGALAQVGRELIADVNRPDFLERLCETTTRVLRCDVAATLIEREGIGSFVPIASFGGLPEEKDVTRVLEVPAERMAWLLGKLERDDVFEVAAIPSSVLSAEQQRMYGVASALCLALRRGSHVAGVQVAYRRGGGTFGTRELRIARGLAQLATLALDHARLVEELERTSRVRSEFIATVSHELRTPLNIILGYGDLLLTDTFGPLNQEQRGTLERMDRRARELLELVNLTLDASRLERGQVPLDVHVADIADIAAAVDAETRELQNEAGLALRIEIPADGIRMRTDAGKLKVVLKNLVVNALKFTEQGEVVLRVAALGDRVTIEVIDTGPGIPPELVPVIFQAFRQGEDVSLRGKGGVGLGLFIVASFVELLGGAVSVDSTVGRGSTFRVELPREL